MANLKHWSKINLEMTHLLAFVNVVTEKGIIGITPKAIFTHTP